jgi:hypothetical protein
MMPSDVITSFQTNATVGSCGSGIERGLGAIQAALQQTGQGQCNAGFVRSNANLVIIILSDEDDTDMTDVSTYVDFLGQQKGGFSKVRVAMITGSENGMATNCSIVPAQAGTCGQSVCKNEPSLGSMKACASDTDCAGPTPTEFCNAMNQCENTQHQNWDPMFCNWCTLFAAPDCCTALLRNNPLIGEGGRYVKFAQQIEAKVVAADPTIMASNCRPANGASAACLVDSICQDNYSDTLSRIATELVSSSKYILDPPATYPAGVTVKLVNKDGSSTDLVNGTDFTVSSDGTSLTITNGAKAPGPDQTVQIFFTVAS